MRDQARETEDATENHRSLTTLINPQQVRLPAQPGTPTAAPASGSHTKLSRATSRKHLEWSLLINALVEIRHKGHVIRTGFVEDVMPDSSALWIAADVNGPRQMFEASEGHQVWVAPKELPGELRYRMTTNQIFRATSAPNAKATTSRLIAAPSTTACR